MNPGADPPDPLELALLMEAAEDLADSDDKDTPPGDQAADGGGQHNGESYGADASALHQVDSAGL